MGLFLYPQIYSIGLYVYPYSSDTVLIIIFVVSLKSGCVSPPTLLFFFKICLTFQTFLQFHINLRISFPFRKKKAIWILIEIEFNL